MKKKTFFIIGCVILLCIGGWFVNRQVEYNKSEEAAIEFINEYYAEIDDIEITNKEKLPTGSIAVSGYINNNTDLYFSVLVSELNYSINGISQSSNFPNPVKGVD